MGLLCGSYLKKPKTEKESSEESNEKLNCGSSSMQGWRLSQEDAHNCILDYDTNTSFFAVYDGHGGPEVAQYTAQHFPEFLKNYQLYKSGDYVKALEESFLDFDATIKNEDVVEQLKVLARQGMDASDNELEDEDEENVKHLLKEATMPIEEVIEKYASSMLSQKIKSKEDSAKSLDEENSSEEKPSSSSSTCSTSTAVCATSSAPACSSSSSSSCTSTSSTNDSVSSTEVKPLETKETKEVIDDEAVDSSSNNVVKEDSKLKDEAVTTMNGEVPNTENAISSTTQNGESPSKKGKGKALTKSKGANPEGYKTETEIKVRPQRRRTHKKLYEQLLQNKCDVSDSSDSEDENDGTFVEPAAESSNDEDEVVNHSVDNESTSEEDEDEEDEDDEEEDDEEDDDSKMDEQPWISEFPGVDSGCTAVVALLKDNTLYVANAGDSRCIVCQDGKALDMSIDHKPEDDLEESRITKAGGCVHADGRIDGGLNLSRAFGDHKYKDREELGAREQKVIALPDVRTLTIDPKRDEFMVLACDGIWNFMNSQEVVEFVRSGIQEGKSLSKICEEMFEHCLAPDTLNDGTGCDNMTCIIVQFKQTLQENAKRPLTPDQVDTKRVKTDDENPTPTPETV